LHRRLPVVYDEEHVVTYSICSMQTRKGLVGTRSRVSPGTSSESVAPHGAPSKVTSARAKWMPSGEWVPWFDKGAPRASSDGAHHICMHRKKINVSTVLAGQKLGIKEVDDGIWLVSFMHGYIDLEQRTLQTIGNPFGTRLSPMS
jgi:hypothetical protein